VKRAVLALGTVVVLVVAGCGGGNDATLTTTSTTTTTTSAQTTNVRIYFLRDGQVWPVARHVPRTPAVATAALDQLLLGPTKTESIHVEVATGIPAGTAMKSLAISNGVATVELSNGLAGASLAQVVVTLTQFPTVKSVSYQGKRYTRADFETQTPPILVESPLGFQEVSSPVRVTGTANTFEATFQYELRDADGKILSKHFEMATSGSGTRGTFDFTVPFTIDRDGPGTLTVYEDSAENGARIHVQEIPLELKR
jgi:germination protein M